MAERRQYRELPDLELGPELDENIRAATEVADRDIEEMTREDPEHRCFL